MNANNRAASNEAGALDVAADAPETAARGHFIHVYVDRASERPVALPDRLSQVVKELA